MSQWLEVYFLCLDTAKYRYFDDETGILLREMTLQSGKAPENETRMNTFAHDKFVMLGAKNTQRNQIFLKSRI